PLQPRRPGVVLCLARSDPARPRRQVLRLHARRRLQARAAGELPPRVRARHEPPHRPALPAARPDQLAGGQMSGKRSPASLPGWFVIAACLTALAVAVFGPDAAAQPPPPLPG